MSTKHDILQAYVFENMPKKQIATRLGISKNTVKKYINEFEAKKSTLMQSGETADKDRLIQLICESPTYDTSHRKRRVVNESMMTLIKQYLAQNEAYRQQGMTKQCMKAIDIHDALVDAGFSVSYSTINQVVNQLRQKSHEAFIKQVYQNGDVCEFDWGEVKLMIDDKLKTYKMAVMTSAKGNYRYAIVYPKEATEFFLDAHVQFFKHIGGVYKTMVYDNMKVAVAKFVGKNEKEATGALKNLSLYYGFRYRFCNIRRGNEKGHVEKSVDVVRRKAFSRQITFDSLTAANQHLQTVLTKHNAICPSTATHSPAATLENEKKELLPLLPDFDIAVTKELRVDKYSAITFEGNHYSVPDSLVKRFITAKIYTDTIHLFYASKRIATHPRLFGANQWHLDIAHYKRTLLRKPGALKGSLAFASLDEQLQTIFNDYFQDNPKEFILTLDLISNHSLEHVLAAIHRLQTNHVYINVDNIKLMLERQQSPKTTQLPQHMIDSETTQIAKETTSQYNHLFNLDPTTSTEVAI